MIIRITYLISCVCFRYSRTCYLPLENILVLASSSIPVDHFELGCLRFYASLGWLVVSSVCFERSYHLDGTLSTNSPAYLVRVDFRFCLYVSKIVYTAEFLLIRNAFFFG